MSNRDLRLLIPKLGSSQSLKAADADRNDRLLPLWIVLGERAADAWLQVRCASLALRMPRREHGLRSNGGRPRRLMPASRHRSPPGAAGRVPARGAPPP